MLYLVLINICGVLPLMLNAPKFTMPILTTPFAYQLFLPTLLFFACCGSSKKSFSPMVPWKNVNLAYVSWTLTMIRRPNLKIILPWFPMSLFGCSLPSLRFTAFLSFSMILITLFSMPISPLLSGFTPPPGFPEYDATTGERMVWRLRKSLYGLQNAPRLWFNLVNASLLSLDFVPHVLDPCLYLKFFNVSDMSSCPFVLIVLYVDDMGICGTWTSEVERVKSVLFSNYKMKDLGLAGTSRTFLSLQLNYTANGIFIHQRHYIDTLVERANLQRSKPRSVPIQDTLAKFLFNATLNLALSDICSNLIGGLLFIARISRLDIANISRELSMHTRSPSSKLL